MQREKLFRNNAVNGIKNHFYFSKKKIGQTQGIPSKAQKRNSICPNSMLLWRALRMILLGVS
jgi:hypothetical protein